MARETRPRRGLPASILILIGAVLLAQAAYFGFSALRRPPGATPVRVELRDADSFYSLKQQRPISLTYQTVVEFSASGPPGETLPLRNYEIKEGQAQETFSRTITLNASGALTSTADALSEGLNLFTIEDRWKAYDSRYVWFLHRENPYDLKGITRTLKLSLTVERASATYRAVFPPRATDADLNDLLAGRIEPALFVKRVFYGTSDDFTCELFADVHKPRVTIKEGISSVEIQAMASDAQLAPKQLDTLLDVSPPQDPSADLPTTVTVTAGEGVAVRGYSPIPTVVEGRTYSWLDSGPISLNYDASGELDPTSEPVASVRRELQRVLVPLWEILGTPITILLVIVLLAMLFFPLARLWQHIRAQSDVLEGEVDLLPPLEGGAGFIIVILTALAGGAMLLLVVAVLAGGFAWFRHIGGFWFEQFGGRWFSGAVWAAAIGCVVPLALHPYRKAPLRWLWLILFPLLAARAISIPGRWSALAIALAGAPLLLFIYWLGREFARPGAFLKDDLGSGSGRVRLLGLLLLLVVLAFPVTQTPSYYSPLSGWWPFTGLSLTLLTLLILVPLAALLAALGLLRRQGRARVDRKDVEEAEKAGVWDAAAQKINVQKIEEGLGEAAARKTQHLWALDGGLLAVGQLLLAYFALGVLRRPLADTSALVPIAPILGWVLFRRLVRRPEEVGLSCVECVMLASNRLRGAIGRAVLRKPPYREGEEETGRPQAPPSLKLLQGPRREMPLRDVLFGWGRVDQPWENAKAACARGALLVAVLLILYGPAILNQALARAATPFVLLEALTAYFVPFVARWLLYAFILGYFFPYIRGRHGWQKGLYLALTISACALAQDVLMQAQSVNDVLGLLFEAGQVIVYLSIVAIWTFDLPRVREAGGSAADLLRAVYGLPFLASYLSGLMPALAGVAQSVITGEFSSLVETFVDVVLPTIFQLRGP